MRQIVKWQDVKDGWLVKTPAGDYLAKLIRTAAAELKCCSDPDPSLIKRLEAL